MSKRSNRNQKTVEKNKDKKDKEYSSYKDKNLFGGNDKYINNQINKELYFSERLYNSIKYNLKKNIKNNSFPFNKNWYKIVYQDTLTVYNMKYNNVNNKFNLKPSKIYNTRYDNYDIIYYL